MILDRHIGSSKNNDMHDLCIPPVDPIFITTDGLLVEANKINGPWKRCVLMKYDKSYSTFKVTRRYVQARPDKTRRATV